LIAALLQLLLPVLTSALGAEGVIPATLLPLVGSSAAAIGTLISQLLSGSTTVTGKALAALQSVQSEISALKSAGVLVTLNQANEISALDTGISDSIRAYEASLTKTDPSNLTPLPTTL
jgi:hypothetical protein